MNKQKMNLAEFAELLAHRAHKGIIDGDHIVQMIQNNLLPKHIMDVRGKLRMAVERTDCGNLQITEFLTDHARNQYLEDIA